MFKQTTQVLHDSARAQGASVRELGSATVLTVKRNDCMVEITVPHEVLEWFVSAGQVESDRNVQDWCDYTGYDSTSMDSLADDMADDLRAFICALLERPIRFASTKKLLRTRNTLEWLTSSGWERAIPFGVHGVA